MSQENSKARHFLDGDTGSFHRATGEFSLAGVVITINNRIAFANTEASMLLAVAPEELQADIDHLLPRFIHEEDVALLLASAPKKEARAETAGPRKFHLRVKRGDGKTRWFELQVSNIDYGGQFARLAHFQDVTEQLEDRAKSEHYARELETVSRLSMQLVELSSEDDIFAFIAEKLSELSGAGYTLVTEILPGGRSLVCRSVYGLAEKAPIIQEILGREPVGVQVPIPEGERRTATELGSLRKLSEGFTEMTYDSVDKDVCQRLEAALGIRAVYGLGFSRRGKLLGSANLLMVDDAQPPKRTIEAFAHQVSGALLRHQSEKERQELVEQLRISQRLESVGRLAGGVAHEFNNLLTAIDGNVSVAMLQKDLDGPLATALQDIKRAANRGASLTTQMLAFSRQQIFAPKVLDINSILKTLESMLLPMLGETVKLRTEYSSHAPLILADRGQIEQVVMNLALNARDAMPDGGSLNIATSRYELDDEAELSGPTPPPDVSSVREWCCLSVTDSGTGMDKETQRKIFEPFFTTKPVSMGTGLGLSVVYGIIKQHHAMVNVQSTLGSGTTFNVFFPATQEKRVATTTPPPAESFSLGTGTILMVEDDVLVRRVNRRVLTHLGYKVLEAKDGEEGSQISETFEGPIDLLFTDIIMPQMNGFELAERIRSHRPSIKVLFTSGYSKHATAPERFVVEGLEFIAKPYTPELLAERIRQVLYEE